MKPKKSIDLGSLQWTVTKVNGRIANVTLGLGGLKRTVDYIIRNNVKDISDIRSELISTDALTALSQSLVMDDLMFLGTEFQKMVWGELFKLSHSAEEPRILSYSEFARKCGRPSGTRAVAHSVGLNPIAFILPCHRIIPKECIRNVEEAYHSALDTIFKGKDLYVFNSFDFGEYALGKQMKRELLALEFYGREQ